MRTTIAIAFLPVLTTANAAQDAWASALVSYPASLVLVVIIGVLAEKFPDLTLMEYSEKLLGRIPGKIIGLVYLWVFLWVAAIDLRIYGEMLITGFLPETPLLFITSSMVIASAVAAYAGIEVIGRNADLVFPFFCITILASILSATPHMQLMRLQPVLARGMKPVLTGSVVPISMTLQMLTLSILAPSLIQPKKVTRTAIWSLTSASLVIAVAAVIVVAVLGADAGSRSVFPFFRMVRSNHLGDFLERFEALPMFAWGFGLFIAVSTYLYCGAKGLSQILNLREYQVLIAPMAVIWIVFSIHGAADIFQLHSFLRPEVTGPYAMLLILVPQGILWAAYAVRRHREQAVSGRKGDDKT
jgi:spore germination protein KB